MSQVEELQDHIERMRAGFTHYEDKTSELAAELDKARADRAQTTSDALVVVIRIRDERDEARAELDKAEKEIARLRGVIIEHENDCEVLPEDAGVTDTVNWLRAELESAVSQIAVLRLAGETVRALLLADKPDTETDND